jgi:hypothetical protein
MFGVSPRLIAWLVTLPLAVAGTQFVHSLAYRITTPADSERALELSATGHGYAGYIPLALAIGTVLVAFALIAEGLHLVRASSRSIEPRAWHFAVVAPALFAVQEHLERLIHDGAFPWTTVLGASFIAGLLLQFPFALVAYVLARVLLDAARSIGDLLLRRRRKRPRPDAASWPAAAIVAPRLPALAHGYGSRGPPSALV